MAPGDTSATRQETYRSTSADNRVKVRPFVSRLDWQTLGGFLKLSQRETQIAYLLTAELSETEVAVKLGISPRTVHSHIERLYRKLQVRSRSGLIVAVFETWITLGIPLLDA